MKQLLVIVLAIFIIGAGAFALLNRDTTEPQAAAPSNGSNGSSQQTVARPAQNNGSAGNATSTTRTTVAIKDFAYAPATLKVKKGTTVKWTNEDSAAHTVTSDSGSELASDLLEKGESYEHTFNNVGVFAYHCAPHPNMQATVEVTE